MKRSRFQLSRATSSRFVDRLTAAGDPSLVVRLRPFCEINHIRPVFPPFSASNHLNKQHFLVFFCETTPRQASPPTSGHPAGRAAPSPEPATLRRGRSRPPSACQTREGRGGEACRQPGPASLPAR